MIFVKPKQLQCLHHGATFEPLCAPILSAQLPIDGNLWLACKRLVKGTSWDEAILISEEIKSLVLAVLELCLSEGITK